MPCITVQLTYYCGAVQVMTQAGAYVKEEVWRAFIVLLTNSPELHAYAARSLFRALRNNLQSAQLSLLATATWYIGEPLHMYGSCAFALT